MKKYILAVSFILMTAAGICAQEISLKDYMNLVEENSKDLYLANLDQQLAGAQEKLARSATKPMIAGSAGYTRNLIEIEVPAAVGAIPSVNPATQMYDLYWVDMPYNTKNEFSLSVGMEQMLFDVTVFRALEASSKYRELTGTIYEASRQAILTAAKQVYFQTVLMEEVYNVKAATEQNAYETYLEVQKKYENELASELDVLQAEVNWQINIPETTQAARNRDLAMSSLKHLGGLEPEAEIILTESLTTTPSVEGAVELGSIFGTRPDYQALQGTIDLQEINVSATRAEFFPSLSASAGYGYIKNSDEFELKDGTNAATAGITMTIPIFYGGSRFAKMEDARLELEKARVDLLKKQDEIRTEINNLQLLLDESSSRIKSAETTLKTAEKAYNIMEISSKNGLATQLDLKDARLNLSGAQLNYYAAIYDYLNAYFQWQQAVGEGDELPF